MSVPDLRTKVVLVTGASRGIGLGIARAFAAAGAEVHLMAEGAEVVEAAAGIGARGHIADITDKSQVAEGLARIPRIDVLVNNAGLERLTPLDDASDENAAVFRRIIEINLLGTFLVTRAALPLISDGGRIINTASIWGRVAEPLFGAYVASKHGVIGLTKTWARELGPRRINVNAVCPGWVRTVASMRSLREMAARDGVDEQAVLDGIVGAQALPGLMEPDDIAGPYLFLASDLAINVTGQALGVDRGEVPW
ncbi:SDR family NAD(P)-dependent oxidoreductase [Zavarzinia sp. CC-PAN008]|uniref:SDR family NAD(P)-dependent oxidoreductase n=1 Tax=Zavarzinia sp. CC-PAN008 TaxID=3243332 RepID=UPI003F744CB6